MENSRAKNKIRLHGPLNSSLLSSGVIFWLTVLIILEVEQQIQGQTQMPMRFIKKLMPKGAPMYPFGVGVLHSRRLVKRSPDVPENNNLTWIQAALMRVLALVKMSKNPHPTD